MKDSQIIGLDLIRLPPVIMPARRTIWSYLPILGKIDERIFRKRCYEALSRAALELWDGQEGRDNETKHLCICISRVAGRSPIVRKYLTELINLRLHGCGTVESWLYQHSGIKSTALYESHPEEIQAYRRRWLDSLIKEFSE